MVEDLVPSLLQTKSAGVHIGTKLVSYSLPDRTEDWPDQIVTKLQSRDMQVMYNNNARDHGRVSAAKKAGPGLSVSYIYNLHLGADGGAGPRTAPAKDNKNSQQQAHISNLAL